MRLIRIPDLDGRHQDDTYWVIPPDMETDEAVQMVNTIVQKATESSKAYEFETLKKSMNENGFEQPTITDANEAW